jgi:DNA-binding transcriptional LysR family regulator
MKRVLCATPAYLASHGQPTQPGELANHPCLSYMLGDKSRTWRLLDPGGEEISIAVDSRIHFNNAECILDATLAGHGIAMLPTYLCGPALKRGDLAIVLDGYEPVSSFGRHLYACYTPSRSRLPKVRVFLDELEACFMPVPPWERAD